MDKIIPFKQDGIIPIYQNNEEEKLVNARELHEFMDINSKFADWIKNRIEKYDFIENEDYVTLSKNLENGGKSKEYILKLDTAKEIAMVENNDKGREVRKYFIAVEKEFKEVTKTIPKGKDLLALAVIEAQQMIAEKDTVIKELETTIATDKPYTNFGKAISNTESAILVGVFSKLLENANVKIGQNKLMAWLRDNKYLIATGQRKNSPMQKYVDMGIFKIKETVVHHNSGDRITHTPLVTGKGQKYLTEKLQEYFKTQQELKEAK
jgi:anti-repressor protein